MAVLSTVRDAATPPAHAGLIMADAIEICLTSDLGLIHVHSLPTNTANLGMTTASR